MLLVNQHIGFGAIASSFVSGAVFSDTLGTDSNGWNGYTIVIPVPIGSLSAPSGTPTQIRVSLQAANAEAFGFDACYIGHRAGAGDVYDFAATPVQVLFSGSGGATITAGTTLVSDWASFAWDKASGVTVAIHCNGGGSADNLRGKTSAAFNSYFKAAVSEASTVDKSGYTEATSIIYLLNKIETDGF